MKILRSRSLLIALFLLAVILQILTPFLHAHTGTSSQVGLHMHVANTGFESAVASESGKVFFTNTTEESPEVGVPTSRQSDKFDLIILNFYVLALFALVYAVSRTQPDSSFYSADRFAYQRYSQSSPPLSLAPPLDL
jgi:hypothetical protein